MKRINGMELYRFGDKIGALWRIEKTARYKDVHLACVDASGALTSLIERRSDYSHIFNGCKESAKLLNKALGSIIRAKDKDRVIDPAIYHNLRRRLEKFDVRYEGDIERGLIFVGTPKGSHDLRLLLERGEVNFPEELKSVCPEAIPDIREGTKCLVYEVYTASAFHFHRANETVVMKYMGFVGARCNEEKNLASYIRALKNTRKVPHEIIRVLHDARDQRNPIMHPAMSVYDFKSADSMFTTVRGAITRMVREMTKPA